MDEAAGVSRAAPAPVSRFLLIAFAISYLAGVPLLMFASGAIPPTSGLLRHYAPRLLVVFGPAIAALIMARGSRDGGASRLLRRLIPRRDDLIVGLALVLVASAVSVGALLAAGVSRDEFGTVLAAHPGLLAAHFALQLGLVAIGEELGWRGWLLPHLAGRMSRLRATVITGAIWTVWHGPLLFGSLSTVAPFVLGVFGLSVLFAALVFHADGRIFTAVVAHASVNTPLFFWELAAGPDTRPIAAWATLGMVYAATALLLIVARWRWWNEPVPAPRRVALRDSTASRRGDSARP